MSCRTERVMAVSLSVSTASGSSVYVPAFCPCRDSLHTLHNPANFARRRCHIYAVVGAEQRRARSRFCYIGVSRSADSHLNANQIVELLQMLILLIDGPV